MGLYIECTYSRRRTRPGHCGPRLSLLRTAPSAAPPSSSLSVSVSVLAVTLLAVPLPAVSPRGGVSGVPRSQPGRVWPGDAPLAGFLLLSRYRLFLPAGRAARGPASQEPVQVWRVQDQLVSTGMTW